MTFSDCQTSTVGSAHRNSVRAPSHVWCAATQTSWWAQPTRPTNSDCSSPRTVLVLIHEHFHLRSVPSPNTVRRSLSSTFSPAPQRSGFAPIGLILSLPLLLMLMAMIIIVGTAG